MNKIGAEDDGVAQIFHNVKWMGNIPSVYSYW